MTNREYLAQNPEEMHGMIKKAADYVENTFGAHTRLMLTDEELLEKWLNAEHMRCVRKTYIANIALIMHDADDMNIDEARQRAACIVSAIRRSIALASFDIDDVTVAKVVPFGND